MCRCEPALTTLQSYEGPEDVKTKEKEGKLPRYVIITTEFPQMELPRLYKAANAFVLPTRGEGWGLPIMQAMAMEMPAIATNWSGPTDFMTKDTSYLLDVEKMVPNPSGAGRMAQVCISYDIGASFCRPPNVSFSYAL